MNCRIKFTRLELNILHNLCQRFRCLFKMFLRQILTIRTIIRYRLVRFTKRLRNIHNIGRVIPKVAATIALQFYKVKWQRRIFIYDFLFDFNIVKPFVYKAIFYLFRLVKLSYLLIFSTLLFFLCIFCGNGFISVSRFNIYIGKNIIIHSLYMSLNLHITFYDKSQSRCLNTTDRKQNA